jgi:hypothetical protein
MKNFFDVLFKYGDNKDFDKQHLVVCEKLHMLYNHINQSNGLFEFQTRSKQVLLPKRR